MKKTINLALLLLIVAVLCFGVVATVMTISVNNPKIHSAQYNNNGKKYVYTETTDANKKYSVYKKSDGTTEYISEFQGQKRYEKHLKLLMEDAKTKRDQNQNDNTIYAYNEAKADYEKQKIKNSTTLKQQIVLTAQTFFAPYVLIAALLGAGVVLNNKLGRDK